MRAPRAPLAAILLTFFLTVTAAAQKAPSSIERSDPPVTDELMQYCDALSFKARTDGSTVHVEVGMNKPVQEGMFTCVHLFLDCDNKDSTGIGGAELWVRAAVGSRFHPNDFVPSISGERKPMELRRASFSTLGMINQAGGGRGASWMHRESLATPIVEGKIIRFSFPTSILREYGDRYGSVIGIMAEVETSCTDQPLMLDRVCQDEGLKIKLDGVDEEWSGANMLLDSGNELHKAARSLDITSFRLEHGPEKLFASVDFAAEGFGSLLPEEHDISRRDSLTFYVEPLYPRYQSPTKIVISWGRRVRDGIDRGMRWEAVLKGKTLEFAVDRQSAQNRIRMFVWSDIRRYDQFADGKYMRLDWAKK